MINYWFITYDRHDRTTSSGLTPSITREESYQQVLRTITIYIMTVLLLSHQILISLIAVNTICIFECFLLFIHIQTLLLELQRPWGLKNQGGARVWRSLNCQASSYQPSQTTTWRSLRHMHVDWRILLAEILMRRMQSHWTHSSEVIMCIYIHW